jgi:6-phosphogluconolactonase
MTCRPRPAHKNTPPATPVAGSPFTAGVAPVSVTVDPSGRFVYVSNNGNGAEDSFNVSAYTLNPSTGASTETTGSPFARGGYP